MRRSTSRLNHRRQPHFRALQARVSSPRIRLQKSLRVLRWTLLFGLIGAGLYAGGLALRQSWRELFHENPDYLITDLQFHTNGHLDEAWFRKVTDYQEAQTVFSVDIEAMRTRLEAEPEVISADLVKRLPGSLEVHLKERIPAVWVACPELNLIERDAETGLLADRDGRLFRCEGRMWEVARDLPILRLKAPEAGTSQQLEAGQELTRPAAQAALKLALASSELKDGNAPQLVRISERNDFSLTAEFSDQTEAVFGLFDHQRQLADYQRIWTHTQSQGRELARVNLIPSRNIPVTFRAKRPRRALIVEE